jgi:hypothetical protein
VRLHRYDEAIDAFDQVIARLGGPDRRTLFILTAEWRPADGHVTQALLTSASSRDSRYVGLFGAATPMGRRGPVGDRYLQLVFAAAF